MSCRGSISYAQDDIGSLDGCRDGINRGARIRTGDLRHPKAARYQAAPRPEAPSVRRHPLGFAAVADVRPINALHYDLDAVGSLGDVAAPPYDVIDAEQRAGAAASARPTTRSRSTCRSRTARPGPQRHRAATPTRGAARTIEAWREAGALVDDAEPAIWAMTQDYTGPDGDSHTRHGILARVRVEDYEAGQVRPHERTLPGPQAGPPRPDPGHAATTSRRSSRSAPRTPGRWSSRRSTRTSPGARRPTKAAPSTRVWRVGDPERPRRGHRAARRRPAADRRRPPPLRDRARLPRRGRRRGRPTTTR